MFCIFCEKDQHTQCKQIISNVKGFIKTYYTRLIEINQIMQNAVMPNMDLLTNVDSKRMLYIEAYMHTKIKHKLYEL